MTFHVKHPEPIKGARIRNHDLDIEYEVRTRRKSQPSNRRFSRHTWKVRLITPHFKEMVWMYQKLIGEGKRVRVIKYTTETITEELFL